MSGQKVAVCKCGCPRTMESSGLWHPPLVSYSLCSNLMVSLQSLSSELGLMTGLGCGNLPAVTVTVQYLRDVWPQ